MTSAPDATPRLLPGDADLRDFLRCAPVHTFGDDPTSRISIYYPTDRVTVTRVVGRLSTAVADAFEAYLTPRIALGGFHGIHDWTQVTSFDLAVPPRLAAWTVARLSKITRIVIASDDPMTSMAVRTTNLTIKRIEHLSTRAQFFAALGPLVGRSV